MLARPVMDLDEDERTDMERDLHSHGGERLGAPCEADVLKANRMLIFASVGGYPLT